MNIYLFIILAVLISEYVLDVLVEYMNIRNASPVLPEEFKGYYDSEKYKKSQNYLVDNTKFGLFKSGISTVLIVLFILLGGFNVVDRYARGFDGNSILSGLTFAGVLILLS